MDNSYEYDFSGLDEYLTEYIDGTMDPSIRSVFEELISQNPPLAEHVCRLRNTRSQLFELGCFCSAPPGFQSRLQRRISCESGYKKSDNPTHSVHLALLCSVVVIMLIGYATHRDLSDTPNAGTFIHVSDVSGMALPVTAEPGSIFDRGRSFGVPLSEGVSASMPIPALRLPESSTPRTTTHEYVKMHPSTLSFHTTDSLFNQPLSFSSLSLP